MPDPHTAAEALRAAQRALENEVAALKNPPPGIKGCLAATRAARAALYESLGGKACKCGALYTAESFAVLGPPLDRARVEIAIDGVKHVETFRKCSCGNTLVLSAEVVL